MVCAKCGREYSIKDMRYIPYDDSRMCLECFTKHKAERLSVKKQENEVLEEEALERRHNPDTLLGKLKKKVSK